MHALAEGYALPLEIRSAGTHARHGRSIHPQTAAALERHRIDSSAFRSRRLSAEDVEWADLVLTMTTEHREEVVGVSPRGLRKVFTLIEAAALGAGLPAGGSNSSDPRARGAQLVDALTEARALRRALPRDYDIVDPIDGPAELHMQVVAEVAAAVRVLIDVLDVPAMGEQTNRMNCLPPVPPRR
jgi:protein-tyrosine phosphatase